MYDDPKILTILFLILVFQYREYTFPILLTLLKCIAYIFEKIFNLIYRIIILFIEKFLFLLLVFHLIYFFGNYKKDIFQNLYQVCYKYFKYSVSNLFFTVFKYLKYGISPLYFTFSVYKKQKLVIIYQQSLFYMFVSIFLYVLIVSLFSILRFIYIIIVI